MGFLYFLESIRIPFITELMLLITHLGEETALLVMALIVFWCVDKYRGYYLLGVGLFGNMANQALKITCQVPRPWVKDPGFTPVPEAIGEAGGYSFPSGHTQTAFGTFGAIAASSKRKMTIAVCCICHSHGFLPDVSGCTYPCGCTGWRRHGHHHGLGNEGHLHG